MFIFYAHSQSENQAKLLDEEARHCSKVLRKKIGDEILLTYGDGYIRKGSIVEVDRHTVSLNVAEIIDERRPAYHLAIAIAPTKNMSRFEWFLEKAVEIGISEIIPFVSKHSERKNLKAERCRKILISAMKQSKNVLLPKLHELTHIKEVFISDSFDQKFIAHCMDPEKHLKACYEKGKKTIVLIGPEGDFTKEEVDEAMDAGFQEISLGSSRLRTETAGVVSASIINVLNA